MVVLALVLVAFAIWSLTRVPTGFLPTEDQGYMIVVAQLPDGASKERTDAVLAKIHRPRGEGPRRRACGDGQRHLDPRQSRQPRQRRRRLRRAEGLGRAPQGEGAGSGVDPAAHQRRLAVDPRSLLLRRAAAADPGRRQCRRLHDAGRDPQRRFRLRPAAKPRQHGGRGRQCAVRPPAAGHDLPRRRAAILGRRRPDEGRGARGHRRPGVRRAIRLCRLELRDAVQQVRPCLPGLHPGESGQARLGRRHPQSQGQGRQRNDDADRHGRRRQAR